MDTYRSYLVPFLDMEFIDVLSTVAILSTIGLFLCGIPICQNVMSKGSTDGVSPAPFLLGTISCCFWLTYGILKWDTTVIQVNSIGLFLEVIYLMLYLVYTRNKTTLNRQLFVLVLCTGGMFFYVQSNYVLAFDSTLNNLGLMCVTLNILNFAAPLAGLRDVLRTQTTESIPFSLCVANLVVSAQWFMYGILMNDTYIKMPNFIGIILALIQLSLFLIYPTRRQHKG